MALLVDVVRASSAARASRRLVELNACIAFLERSHRLVRVRSEVDPRHELGGIARRFEGGKCVLFERVKGSDYPVFTGLLWNRDTVGALFGLPATRVPFRIAEAIVPWKKNRASLTGRLVRSGPANEVTEPKADLGRLPIPVHALRDGGPYLDASVVLARNPQTGALNISLHRMMVTGKDRITFLIDPGRHLGEYVEYAEQRGETLPVTINNGVGVAPWIVAALPRLGDGKLDIANHLAGHPIDLVQAQTGEVPAYADAQFVVEAEILPGVREYEAPFAEVTGYYGSRDRRWVMKVNAITRRAQPVFHTLLSGAEVWNAVAFSAEAAIFHALKARIPEVRAVYLPPGGCGFYEAVVQVENTRAGLGREVIEATFAAFRSLQWVVVVDADVDLFDAVDVDWAITTRFDADTDLVLKPGAEGHILNPVVAINRDGKGGTVTKMGIDALVPFARRGEVFERVKFKQVDLRDYDILES